MLAWCAVDARTGVLLDWLPDLVLSGQIAQTIGRYETAQVTVPLPKLALNSAQAQGSRVAALQSWRACTRPGGAVLVACDDQVPDGAGNPLPVWGGLVLTRGTSEASIANLGLTTIEAYFDRRYGGNYGATNWPQDQIARDLVNFFAADNAVPGEPPGIPIRVANVTSTQLRTRSYYDTDDKTVYTLLTDLAGLDNPIEWTVGWEWGNTIPRKITPVLYVADRLGVSPRTGMAPNALFSMGQGGCVTTAQFSESYEAGKGADYVTATGQSSQDSYGNTVRPQQSYPATPTGGTTEGRPLVEYRWSPSTSAIDTPTLLSHATRAYALMRGGQTALTLTASVWEAPVYGRDWQIGDDVSYQVEGDAWLDGWLAENVPTKGRSRVMGWQRDDNTISPVLAGGDLSPLVQTP